MRGLGIMLLIFGIGSFVLPMMGMQFRLLSLFGEYSQIAGGVLAVIGAILVAVSFKTGSE